MARKAGAGVFTVADLRELLRLLDEHPEWKSEIRRSVLTDDLLDLPKIVRELAEAQTRTEQSLAALTQRVAALADRVDALTQRMDALAQAQQRTEQSLAALTQRVDALAEEERRMATVQASLLGSDLERVFREKVPAIVRRPLRAARLVPFADLAESLDAAVDAGQLSPAAADDVLRAAAVVRARDPEGEVFVVVEVCRVVDRHDVERAERRAGALADSGRRVRPGVCGQEFTKGAEAALADRRVLRWRLSPHPA